ncbi:MAG TPA: helix-turn-helix transcriptional regulator [Roseomonas sp.]
MTARGIGFNFVDDAATRPAGRGSGADHHVLVVQLDGAPRSMETIRTDGPPARMPPEAMDLPIVPTARQHPAAAPGDIAGYCEITIPKTLLGNCALGPDAAHHDPFLHQLTLRLASLAGREDGAALLLRDSLAEALRLHLLDSFRPCQPPTAARTRTLDQQALRTLLDDLRGSLDTRHTLTDMAARFGMTNADFLKAFQQACGTTPYQWLIGARIAAAKAMLADAGHPITAIALAVGFATPSHFATAFKEHVGMTPSRYRLTVCG